jgi:hypothetical protein
MSRRLTGWAAAIGALSGCGNPDGGYLIQDGLSTASFDARTGRDGYTDIRVNVDGFQSLLLTIQTDDIELPYVSVVRDPSGEVVLDAEALWAGDEQQSNAIFPDQVVSINWPPLGVSAPLSEGEWVFEVGALDNENYPTSGVSLTVDGQLKADPDLSGGVLQVDLVYGAAFDADVLDAIDGAVDHWREIYAQIGIDLDIVEYDYPSGDLAAPGSGDAADYIAIAETTRFRAVNVVIVDDIVGQSDILGIAGGIPGALVASPMSAVTISAAMNAGVDLEYDAEEVMLLGETLAHEVGHYTGLFHPVESSWTSYDGLSDTPRCDGEAECIASLGDNLMFPFPVCASDGCTRQGGVTEQQGETSNLYTAVE